MRAFKMTTFKTIVCALIVMTCITAKTIGEDRRPDIVFIIVDDLNDWVGCLSGHPDARSPNIDQLASTGMLFTQAYCNSPQCRPSRTSLNHGIYPFRTGTYFNARSPQETKISTPSMQKFFADKGFQVSIGGKVFHGGTPKIEGVAIQNRLADPKPPKGKDNFGGLKPPNDGYPLDATDEQMGDYKLSQWAIRQWNKVTDQPVFMSVGFYRPHRPLQVPKPWFDQFPLESIKRPAEPKGMDDWDDLPEFAQRLARTHAHKPLHMGLSDHEFIVANKQWDMTIQAYQASIAFVDHQIGRLLNALKVNPRGRETYIVLVSDHGWHLGEKKHWCKGAIWEQTTHIPFIVHGPGITQGSRCTQPVSLIDIYPSLLELAGYDIPAWVDGKSIKIQLTNPNAARPPVISSYGEGNTSIRTEHWRYIRYEDGSEELYDHRIDPNEWKNQAANHRHARIRKQLAKLIPTDQHTGLKVQDWFEKFQD